MDGPPPSLRQLQAEALARLEELFAVLAKRGYWTEREFAEYNAAVEPVLAASRRLRVKAAKALQHQLMISGSFAPRLSSGSSPPEK